MEHERKEGGVIVLVVTSIEPMFYLRAACCARARGTL